MNPASPLHRSTHARATRILMFTISPLFSDQVNGGSTRQLRSVAIHLAESGHQVRILCAAHPHSRRPFHWPAGVEVRPELPFHQPFPSPYAMHGYQFARLHHLLQRQLDWAERFYVHDGELLFPNLLHQLPTVISFRDVCYPESLIGSFLGSGDAFICVSEFAREVMLATAGQLYPELAERCHLVPNCVDTRVFRPIKPSPTLHSRIGADLQGHRLLLHPHRNEDFKGLQQSLALLAQLLREPHQQDLRLLVPAWRADGESSRHALQQQIQRMGLASSVILHDWIPQHLMPEYYALGDLTLALGNVPEAYGNSAFESLACGTPVIAAQVGNYRFQRDTPHLHTVPWNAIPATAEAVATLLNTLAPESDHRHSLLRQPLTPQGQRQAYARIILDARRMPALKYQPEKPSSPLRYRLPPWCSVERHGRIYHDFQGNHRNLPGLVRLLGEHPEGIPASQLAGRQQQLLALAVREGFLVPEWQSCARRPSADRQQHHAANQVHRRY